MTSLFDLAADLGRYDGRCPPSNPSPVPETALGILDDALQSIYGVGNGRVGFSASSPALLTQSPAAPIASCRPMAPAKSVSCLSDRLDQLMGRDNASAPANPSTATRASGESQRDPPKWAVSSPDADLKARSVLRELGEEVELLRMHQPSGDGKNKNTTDNNGAADVEQVAAMLTHKYVTARLDALPGTPFVMLAKKKTRHKIEQLRLALGQRHEQSKPTKVAATEVTPESTSSPASNASDGGSKPISDEWWQRVETMLALPPDKQAALRRLMALPESHLRRLPAAQREIATFAKRMDALLRLPEAQQRRLPPEHQRMLEALRQRQQQG